MHAGDAGGLNIPAREMQPIAHDGTGQAASGHRHHRKFRPAVRRRIALSDIVDWYPGLWPKLGRNKTTKGIELSIELREGDIVGRQCHRFFLRPRVRRRVILVHQP